MDLKPVRPQRIADLVVDQLREMIFRGDFKPGTQIMPERDIAAMMQVSRATVRNAINSLVVMGLLEHRQGKGTFIATPEMRCLNPLATALTNSETTFADLLEARLGLECNAAELAALKGSEQDIDHIEKSLRKMASDLEITGRIGAEADAAFHMAVSFAARNRVLIHLMRSFQDLLLVGIQENLSHMYDSPKALEQVMLHHTAVYDSIRNRRAEEAGDMMRLHILYIQEYFHSTGLPSVSVAKSLQEEG